jgi:ribonuclease P protein component
LTEREGRPIINANFGKWGVEGEKDIPAKEKQAAGHLWVFSKDEHPRGPKTHQSEKGEGSEKAGLELRGRGKILSLPPGQRIRKTREFREVLAKGRKVGGEHLQFFFCAKGASTNRRLGVSLRKSLGSAVVRNRSKRLVKEAFRLHESQLPPGTDLIVAVMRDLSGMKLQEVERIFSGMLARSGSISKTWG